MTKLLRLTMLMMGILVLMVSAVLVRSPREKPMAVGVASIESLGSGILIYTVLPEDHLVLPITPGLAAYPDIFGVSSDGLWVYVYSQAIDAPGATDFAAQAVYRVRLDGRVVERVTTDQIRSRVWWVNQRWIVYIADGTEPSHDFMVKQSLDRDGRQMVMDWPFANSPSSLIMSPDGSQIAYTLSLEDGGESDVLVVPTSGGEPRNLTANIEGDLGLRVWTAGDEWLLAMTRDYQLLGLRADGSYVKTIVGPSMSKGYQFGIRWVDAAQVLLVHTANREVLMIRIGQPVLLWTRDGFALPTPDEQHFIIQEVSDTYVGTVWKMPIAGGERQWVATIPNMHLHGALSPDSKWLLVAVSTEENRGFHLVQLDLQDGTTKTVFSDQEYYLGYDWSLDGAWISVAENPTTEGIWVVMRPDGSERQTIRFKDGLFASYPTWYQSQPADWSSRDMIAIGAGLMVGAIGMGRVRGKRA